MTNNELGTKPPNRLAGDEGFKGKTLLVTGTTGFMGKVFIEKMLRTCPLVEKIFVIIRTKKGADPETRLNELFSSPLYDLLKNTRGIEILRKVIAISGDVSELDLGLSECSRRVLTEEVEIIFHFAATVRFDEPFKKTVLLNTRGTKLMLDLAKECKKLLVFAYISTAYSHPKEKILYEKAYPSPADPYNIIKVVELLDEDTAEVVGERIKGDSPNVYTFSKALAETIIDDEMDNLPVITLRPSIVIPVWKDPLPGWTDNINGPVGMLIAGGKGVLRSMHCNKNTFADFLPVDVAANLVMMSTYDYMTSKKRRIYHLTSSEEVQISWNEIVTIGKSICTTTMPFNWVVWYPDGCPQSSKLIHNISVIIYHYIPAIILDSLMILTGKKPILWKIQQRITQGFKLFDYYANNQWYFNNDNLVESRKSLNETEIKTYKVDSKGLDVERYLYDMIRGARLYVLKETDESLPTARRHLKVMWAVDRISKLLVLIGFGYLILKYAVGSKVLMDIASYVGYRM